MYNTVFFYITSFFYLLTAYFFIIYMVKKKAQGFAYFRQWLWVSVLSGAFCLLTRYREAGYLPLVTLFEITFFYALMITVLYALFVKERFSRFIQASALLIIYGILAWNMFMDKNIYPLNPLLDSFWLGIHVPAAILSYGAFSLSFAVSLYYLFAEKKKTWAVKGVSDLNSRLITGGVVLLGVCIITGAVWAKSAWGSYWTWDPKETWALITFIIYGAALLMRHAFRLNPKLEAVVSVSGFLAMLFTFFGVGLFLSSHHAYR